MLKQFVVSLEDGIYGVDIHQVMRIEKMSL